MRFILVAICSVVMVAAVPQRSYLDPERNEVVTVTAGQPNPVPYEYQIVPSSGYAVASYQTDNYSLLDYILSPITALVSVGSTALSVAHWVLIKGGLVLFGMAIVIGFCGFTSYCTLTIENPFSRGLPPIPYLDEIQYYFSEAYNKYHELQNYL